VRTRVYSKVLPRHVYIHVPFCARRCSYCDFSIAVRSVVPVREFIDAIDRELAMRHVSGDAWQVDTLYLGGGTPSRLGGEGVAELLGIVRKHLSLADGAEVTLEANPEDITAEAVRAWRAAGVNRLSIGAQSFDDRVLKWMHRVHDSNATLRAVEFARAGGIENLSLDLIFALPESLERDWQRDVDRVLSLEPSHVSLYGLTVEPHTPLGRWSARGDVAAAPEERYEEEFLHAHAAMAKNGFEHYEVSNFARPNARSRHNAAYWLGVPYAGIGPSAHGFDGEMRFWNVAPYAQWQSLLHEGRDARGGEERLSEDSRMAETVYLGLRTLSGVQLKEEELERTRRWVDAGWASVGGDNRLTLTPDGWLRLDSLSADLTLVRSR